MDIKKIKGTRDYFGIETQKLELTFKILEEISKEYNLNKIVTPTFESTDLFSRAVGSNVDVVNKEMYTFNDRKGRSISLRPEGTASVVRLLLENKQLELNNKPQVYYISSMFRYERPQKGRQREFFQFGVEKFGNDCMYVDTETILMTQEILNRLEINKFELQINSIGNSEDRKKYNVALKEFLNQKKDFLSSYAKEKLNSGNILRILDSKIDSDLEHLKDAPSIKDFLSIKSRMRFAKFKKLLEDNKISYVENNGLVRGLDYYNDLVFEYISTDNEKLGTKSTIIGGGRYDYLVEKMDNTKKVPAIGFAIGIERLMLAADDFLSNNIEEKINYYIISAYPEPEIQNSSLFLSNKLRKKGYRVFVDFGNRKLNKNLDLAEKLNVDKIIIVGNEIKDGEVTVKDIKENTKKRVRIEEI